MKEEGWEKAYVKTLDDVSSVSFSPLEEGEDLLQSRIEGNSNAQVGEKQ